MIVGIGSTYLKIVALLTICRACCQRLYSFAIEWSLNFNLTKDHRFSMTIQKCVCLQVLNRDP